MKTCTKCKETKAETEFYTDNKTKDKLRHACKLCQCRALVIWKNRTPGWREEHNAAFRAKYARDAAVRRKYLAQNRRRLYGLSPAEYEVLLAAQNGHCAVCQERDSLCVDHNHKSGRIRGLLCKQHNLLLGHLEKDPQIAAVLLAYLTRAADVNATGGTAAV